ncbi:MAG: phytoene desaturase family protein [Flavitalea sp.]
MNNKAIVIGSGFSGLSAASFMAKAGWKVTVLEMHDIPGGRARQLKKDGFTFDMGPSWYWMPDVFERYFAAFGKKAGDYYSLERLDPSYRVVWPEASTQIPAGITALKTLFESWEKGAAKKLDAFLKEAAFKYKVGIQNLVYKPGLSLLEFANADFLKGLWRMDVFTSMRKHVNKYFRDERIRQLMEFPVLFLGALAKDTPALYSLMNYADIVGGTWYPKGGMYSVVEAMHKLAEELGVEFQFNAEVTGFEIDKNEIAGVKTKNKYYDTDVVIASADYHFVEQHLVPPSHRRYTQKYWDRLQMAPSCFIYYVGLNKKLKNVNHHMLFFDTSFEKHAEEMYSKKSLPTEPLFYVSVTSVTDDSVAPEGCENLFFLIPVAAGLENDSEETREKYFNMIMSRFEKHTGEEVRGSIIYKSTFAHSDFVNEYHSFKGNAYGLANTLMQTANLKPGIRSNKLKNLYYTGQLTVPGPGVPPSLISGEVVAGVIHSIHQIQQS